MDKNLKKWVNIWKKAGPAMEAIKQAELQDEHYYEKNRDLLFDMLDYAVKHGEKRTTSGLVEWQRRIKELKKKNPSL